MGRPVTIDSEQYGLLMAAHKMLDGLYSDPEKGIDFKKMIKGKYPSAQVPELDAMSQTEKMLKPTLDKMEGFLAERQKEKEDAKVGDLQRRFDAVVKENGLTEEGQKKLIGIMRDRTIGNPEDAIMVFNRDLPKAERKSKPYSSRMAFVTPDGEKDADYNKLMNDPDAFMVDGMMDAISDMKKDN